MKIAYIIDASVQTSIQSNNLYKLPYNLYDSKGTLFKTYDNKTINTALNSYTSGNKQYIEPTPGMFRDMYKTLLSDYDHIIVLPNHSENNLTYTNALYASKLFDQVTVVDSQNLNLPVEKALKELLNNKQITTEFTRLKVIDFERILEIIKNTFSSLDLLLK